jgi:hypothetical protein
VDWYDWVTLVIMAVVVIAQTLRGIRAGGIGVPLFEAAGGVVAAVATTAVSHGIADSTHLNEGTVMFVLFIAFLALALVVAHWLSALAPLPFQSLDGILSVFCGLVLAWAIAHMFLRIMMGSEGGQSADMIASSPVAREVFQFRTWNSLMRLLFKANANPSFDPTES